MPKTPGVFLKELRLEHHFTQTQVAKRLGITRQAYAYYETHDTMPDLQILTNLAALYDISVRTFLNYYPPEAAVSIAEPKHYRSPACEKNVISEYLTYYSQQENMKKYHYLKPSEKKLLFMFQKLNEDEQYELLQWAYFKSTAPFSADFLPKYLKEDDS